MNQRTLPPQRLHRAYSKESKGRLLAVPKLCSLTASVIFVLIYFLVLVLVFVLRIFFSLFRFSFHYFFVFVVVLVFWLFFRFNLDLVLQHFFVSVLVFI